MFQDKGRLFLMKDIEMVYDKDSLNKRLASGKKEQFAKLPKFLAAVEELVIDWTDQGLIWSFSVRYSYFKKFFQN